MAANPAIDWSTVVSDPRFQQLHEQKSGFLWKLMIFSVVYYFLLPIGAAYFPNLFNIQVWGPVNLGLVFALSEFIVAWGVAFYYSRRANREFDALSREVVAEIERKLAAKSRG